MFDVKRVPLMFLGLVGKTYEFHLTGFRAVADTVSPGFELEEFKVYFDYVLELIDRLKPVWNK